MCKYTVHDDDVQWDVVKENWDKLSIKEKDRQAGLPYCIAGCQHVQYPVRHVDDTPAWQSYPLHHEHAKDLCQIATSNLVLLDASMYNIHFGMLMICLRGSHILYIMSMQRTHVRLQLATLYCG